MDLGPPLPAGNSPNCRLIPQLIRSDIAPLLWSYPCSHHAWQKVWLLSVCPTTSLPSPLTFPGHECPEAGPGFSPLLSHLNSRSWSVGFQSLPFKLNPRQRAGAGVQGRERLGEGGRRPPGAQMGSRTDPSQGTANISNISPAQRELPCPEVECRLCARQTPGCDVECGEGLVRERGEGGDLCLQGLTPPSRPAGTASAF